MPKIKKISMRQFSAKLKKPHLGPFYVQKSENKIFLTKEHDYWIPNLYLKKLRYNKEVITI